MHNGLGSGLLEIAMALIGVALVALLVGNASKSAQLVKSAGSTFNDLLQTVTLQNSGGFGGMGVSTIY